MREREAIFYSVDHENQIPQKIPGRLRQNGQGGWDLNGLPAGKEGMGVYKVKAFSKA